MMRNLIERIYLKMLTIKPSWDQRNGHCCKRLTRVLMLTFCVAFVTFTLLYRRHDLMVVKTIVPRLNWLLHDTIPRLSSNIKLKTPIDPDEPVTSPLWRLPIEEIKSQAVKGDIMQYLPEYKNPCWFMNTVDEKGIRCLPYFYLAGVAKSGTTAFFEQIIKHPDIESPEVKETFFWGTPQKRNLAGYLSMFTNAREEIFHHNVDGYHPKITFDASSIFFAETGPVDKYHNNMVSGEPRYTLPHTLYALYPNTKVILTFRNPTDRLFSEYHYHMFYSLVGFGREYSVSYFHDRSYTAVRLMTECMSNRTVRSCIYDSDLYDDIMQGAKFRLHFGMYAPYAREWLSVFPRDQIMFIKAEELYANGSQMLRDVFKFLGLTNTPANVLEDIDKDMSRIYNTKKSKVTSGKSYSTKMWTKTREMLDDFYRPFNEQLAELLGDKKWLFEKK